VQAEIEELSNLRQLSCWIGANTDMVQGPGGNTSFKNSEFMWVKGSGAKLEDALVTDIFVCIDLNSGHLSPKTQKLTASIETSLHQMSEFAVVAHTHSTAAITAGFRIDIEELASTFGRIAVIPYCRPGTSLAEEIRDRVDTSIHDIAILKNHGLLVWGNTVQEVQQRIVHFESEFKKIVTYSASELEEARRLLSPGDLNRYLTPDHAVFLDSQTLARMGEHQFEPNWLKQMHNQLCIVLASSLHSKNLSWLDVEEVEALKNWDAEKMRKDFNN